MKKLFALLLALVMALSLVACGEKKDDTGDKTDDSNPSTGMELTQATDLVIATGGTSGAWYPIGVSIADTLTNVDNNLFVPLRSPTAAWRTPVCWAPTRPMSAS